MLSAADAPEVVFGFSARVRPESPDPTWTVEARNRWTLQPAVLRPISAAMRVWPAPPVLGYPRGWWKGRKVAPFDGRWDRLSDLRADCAEARLGAADAMLIALSVVWDDPTEAGSPTGNGWAYGVEPPAPQPQWAAIGWDVCNYGACVSLIHSWHPYERGKAFDARRLRKRFAPFINKYGLFDDIEAASRFRDLGHPWDVYIGHSWIDPRWYVIRIYQIPW